MNACSAGLDEIHIEIVPSFTAYDVPHYRPVASDSKQAKGFSWNYCAVYLKVRKR
jgi:hypothetical protein